jgi:hypothetical protein
MWKIASTVAVVTALAGAGAAFAGDGPSQPFAHPESRGAITLAGQTVQRNLVDVAEPGFTLGDEVAFSDDVREGGTPAGFDGGVCTLVRIADADAQTGTAQCQVTYSLDGGQVTTQGLLTLTSGGFVGTQHTAITGGTGRFRGARGDAELKFVHPGELQITLDVR